MLHAHAHPSAAIVSPAAAGSAGLVPPPLITLFGELLWPDKNSGPIAPPTYIVVEDQKKLTKTTEVVVIYKWLHTDW